MSSNGGTQTEEVEGYTLRQKRLTDMVLEVTKPDYGSEFPMVLGIKSLTAAEIEYCSPPTPIPKLDDFLVGFTAPGSWGALIVASQGEATIEDEDDRGDVIVGYGVGRRDEEVCVIRFEDREPQITTLQLGADSLISAVEPCR